MAEAVDPADRILRRMTALEAARQPWEGEWRDCANLTYPERGYGFEGSFPSSQGGDDRAKAAEIYDDTAKDGARIMASAFVGGMTPANSKWLDYTVGDETDEESRWLSDASEFVFTAIHGSNYDSVAFEGCLDLVSVSGAFVLYTGEEPDGSYRFETWPVGQCFFAASTAGGPVDTVYRRYELTVAQCVNDYGRDKVSDAVREAFDNQKLDDKILMICAIEPRDQSRPIYGGARLARNKPFASCHVEQATKQLVRESGYDEFPCSVPRWALIPGSHYAKGPMSAVRATARTLNEIQRLELVHLEMSAYGMFKATDDGVLNPFTTKIGPRRIVVVADMKNFESITSSGDFKLSFAKKDELQRQVRQLLMADQLQPPDKPGYPTAAEIHARMALLRQQLGPAFGRLTNEWLTRMVLRCFAISMRNGDLEREIGPVPSTLGNRILGVKYSSPLARAQKLEEVTAAGQWVQDLMTIASAAADTSILDQVDMEEFGAFTAKARGVPSKLRRTEDAIQQRRKAKVDAQEQARQSQVSTDIQTAAGTEAAKNLVTAQ